VKQLNTKWKHQVLLTWPAKYATMSWQSVQLPGHCRTVHAKCYWLVKPFKSNESYIFHVLGDTGSDVKSYGLHMATYRPPMATTETASMTRDGSTVQIQSQGALHALWYSPMTCSAAGSMVWSMLLHVSRGRDSSAGVRSATSAA
jgi:hypothetical protein